MTHAYGKQEVKAIGSVTRHIASKDRVNETVCTHDSPAKGATGLKYLAGRVERWESCQDREEFLVLLSIPSLQELDGLSLYTTGSFKF